MIFVAIGFFKHGLDPRPRELAAALNEHLGPDASGLRLAGFLHDADGQKSGFMGLIEADSIASAQRFLRSSPMYEAGMYERAQALEFAIEVGVLR